MRKRPMFVVAWVCALAVLMGLFQYAFCFVLAIAGIIYFIVMFKEDKRKMIAIGNFLILLFFFFFIHTKCEVTFREKSYAKLEDGQFLVLQGEIDRKILENNMVHYTLVNCKYKESQGWLSCNSVILYADDEGLGVGEEVICSGKVKLWGQARNEGNFDSLKYYQSQKIDFSLKEVSVISRSYEVDSLKSFLSMFRENLIKVIGENLSEKNASIMQAMLLGDKRKLDDSVKSLYKNSGISHILAISGLHITFVGFYLFLMIKKTGVHATFNVAVCIIFLYCYCYMTGQSVSTRRAIGMLIITLLGRVLGRAEDLLNSLGFMVCFLLWENPFVVYNTGFLFSCLAILGIGLTSGIILKYIKMLYGKDLKTKRRRCVMKMIQHVAMSVGIFFFTLPLVAYTYFEIPLYGIFINLLVLPMAPFLIGTGVVALFLDVVAIGFFKELEIIIWNGIELLLSFMELVCEKISSWPNAVLLVGRPSISRLLFYIAFFIIFLGVLCVLTKCEYRSRMILFVGVFFLFGVIWVPTKSELQLNVLDVGQGLGVHVQSLNGNNLFFDGGSSDVKSVGKYRIIPFLKSKRISQIDYWFISHLDEDHCNGFLETVSEGYPIKAVIISKYVQKDDMYERVHKLLREYNIPCYYMKEYDVIDVGEGSVTCLWPSRAAENKNDGSLVLRFDGSSDFQALFPGDISFSAEDEMIREKILNPTRFLIAAHHGSNGSSGEGFLKRTNPERIVISCGEHNSYGHPGKEMIKRVRELNIQYDLTMEHGQITLKRNRVYVFSE